MSAYPVLGGKAVVTGAPHEGGRGRRVGLPPRKRLRLLAVACLAWWCAASWTATLNPPPSPVPPRPSNSALLFTPDDRRFLVTQLSGEVNGLEAEGFTMYLPLVSRGEGFHYQVGPCSMQASRGGGGIRIGVQGRDVWMEHDDACYNCCAQLVVFQQGERPLLRFVELETYPDTGPCRCMCYYDLKAWATNLPAGTYHVEVWKGATQELLAEAEVTVLEEAGPG